MVVFVRFYDLNSRKYHNITAKKAKSIDDAIKSARAYVANKYKTVTSGLVTAHYEVRKI